MDRSPSIIRAYRTLSYLAVAHSALLLCALALAFSRGFPEWFDGLWVAFTMLWAFWPIALTLHSGRTPLRFGVPVVVSLLFLIPCVPYFLRNAPTVLKGNDRIPTLDRPNVVGSENLGSGFRRVQLEEFITGGFESIYHGEYLYFRARKLGDFVSSSVAPSRKLAAFVESDLKSPLRDDHFGFHVFLFRASDQKVIRLTQDLQYDFDGFEWDEAAGYVLLRRRHDGPPAKFPLPKA